LNIKNFIRLLKKRKSISLILATTILFLVNDGAAQVIDTIANWDNISVESTIVSASGEVVENPDTQGINPSDLSLVITTSDNPYDLIFTDFAQPVNFEECPLYRLKILAPESGGSVLLMLRNMGVRNS
jgi:hypothetical protein